MTTMFRLTLSNIRAHTARFTFTALAVALGVAFMAGTLVLTATLSRAYETVSGNALDGTDAVVRSTSVITGTDDTEVRATVDESVLATVAAVPGVAAAVPRVEGIAQVVGDDGRLLDDSQNRAVPLAMAWSDDAELSPVELVEGRAPAAAADVVIDRATARAGDFAVGDPIRVVTPAGSDLYTVAGVATYGGADNAAGSPVVAFTPPTATDVIGEPGRYDAVAVRAGPGVGSAELAARIDRALAGTDDVEVLDHDEAVAAAKAESGEDIGFLSTFLLAFALVALLVGSFVISNTFSITVAQRNRETAMLRAIGASRRQVAWATRLEALATGVVASAVGVVLGVATAVGLRALLGGFGVDLPEGGLVVTASTVVVCLAVGVVVTLAAAIVPARRAARVAPVAAMREVAVDRSGRSAARMAAGAVVTALGIVALALGLGGGGAAVVGLGAAAVFVGVSVLGPVIARPLSRFLGAPLPALRGVTGTMARENASRNPKRTSATASALMVGVGLVVFITIFAASARASIADSVDTAARCDWIVDTAFGQGGLSPEAGEAIATLPEVGAMTAMRYSPARVDGTTATVSAFDPAQIERTVDLGLTDGSVTDLGLDGLAVHTDQAEALGVGVGDTVTVELAEAGTQPFRVAAVYDTLEPMGGFATSLAAFEAHGVERVDSFVFVTDADGVSTDEARSALRAALADYPTASLLTIDEFTQSRAGQIDELLGLIDALLLLAVLIALFGIANTLVLSVHERTRELGLLRAVGMTRGQVRSSVRWESVIIALLGTALGLAIGAGFAWALVRTLADQGFQVLAVPVAELALITALAAAAGVAVALLPARAAARVPVLEALRTS
ncbi:MAG: FtsX-like permease family protein [Acidimicrobiales bacterium]|nr:FtsX-like permease family protein [Acidimicrobiales bacterium]